jgi:two-component system, NarL family, sensor histidine kinase BarA
MAQGQSSFRRILLTRLLLLSVPVLLMGVYVTYRKARSAFLETARQNLTESAVRKSESINQSIEALESILWTASDAAVLKSNSRLQYQIFLEKLAQKLPTEIECVTLTDFKIQQVIANTCNFSNSWDDRLSQQQQKEFIAEPNRINITPILPATSLLTGRGNEPINNGNNQLKLSMTAPVYDSKGRLRYALTVNTALLHQERVEPGSLDGYPVVIDRDGTILAHPYPQRVGRNISQMPDSKRLQTLLKNAIAGRPDFLHLFYLEKDGVELVAGYSSIPSPIHTDEDQKWIVLAVTPIDNALAPLKQIREILVMMTLGLISASYLATLYISRDLALPLEKLRDYALKDEHLASKEPIPQDSNVREINQLSSALNEMIDRLKTWGNEIVSAWKEAKNANQLKSEFLATTSHELRTPLNGIINCIRVVKDGYCEDKQEELEFLQQADDAAIHLLGIINDVLDISKIEAGKLSISIEKVDLFKILNEAIDLQTVPIQQKGLIFKVPQYQENLIIATDSAKLKQVLLNVLSNAVKFTDLGSIVIELRTENYIHKKKLEDLQTFNLESDRITEKELDLFGHKTERDYDLNSVAFLTKSKQAIEESHGGVPSTEDLRSNNLNNTSEKILSDRPIENCSDPNLNGDLYSKRVIITVKDTGIGIDPKQQHRLFRPFVMVDGSTTRKFGGTGLGLAISRNLMELMSGSITLFSAGEGKGTTVEIGVPLINS